MGDELVLKIAKITAVDEDIAEDLSNLVDRCLDAASALDNSTVDGVKQVADIINVYDGDSDRLLNLIREHSEELLEEIENLRYDFNVLAVQFRQDDGFNPGPMGGEHLFLNTADRQYLPS